MTKRREKRERETIGKNGSGQQLLVKVQRDPLYLIPIPQPIRSSTTAHGSQLGQELAVIGNCGKTGGTSTLSRRLHHSSNRLCLVRSECSP
jgi:hypothetical protein